MKIIDQPAKALALIAALQLMVGCGGGNGGIEPNICIVATKNDLARAPSAFPPLTAEERKEEWGKELYIADAFARDMDLYRAITSYKRALLLLPFQNIERRSQAEFDIIECYWIGGKYCDAIEIFEGSSLASGALTNFPAYRDLLIILHDSYDKLEEHDRAERILLMIKKQDEELANNLQLSIALQEGDIPSARAIAAGGSKQEAINSLVEQYCLCKLSEKKARTLNALLPGAGYYYVGQKRSAITSFVINALFIGATYHFFSKGNYPAGLITASLESGWYFGGINGAGLAAKEYNERLYESVARGTMTRGSLFPLFMLETTF